MPLFCIFCIHFGCLSDPLLACEIAMPTCDDKRVPIICLSYFSASSFSLPPNHRKILEFFHTSKPFQYAILDACVFFFSPIDSFKCHLLGKGFSELPTGVGYSCLWVLSILFINSLIHSSIPQCIALIEGTQC